MIFFDELPNSLSSWPSEFFLLYSLPDLIEIVFSLVADENFEIESRTIFLEEEKAALVLC